MKNDADLWSQNVFSCSNRGFPGLPGRAKKKSKKTMEKLLNTDHKTPPGGPREPVRAQPSWDVEPGTEQANMQII